MKKKLKKIILALAVLCLAAGAFLLFANVYVRSAVWPFLLTEPEAARLEDIDCVLVLGCGLRKDGTPSRLLSDRINTGVRVYQSGVTDRLLMTGDHGRKEHDEVNAMKAAAVESGIDADTVFCDHAGFSTYESMYRAYDIFGAERIIIVTQEYHLTRAVYDAQKMGITAYGVAADDHTTGGSFWREAREVLARAKDFLWCLFKPEPTYRGEKIPISGSASLTDG